MSKRTAANQLQLGRAIAPIQRCVSMARVEIFVPAEQVTLPAFLAEAFNHRFVDLDCQCETVSVFGCDLSRDLNRGEVTALEMAWERYDIMYRIFKR